MFKFKLKSEFVENNKKLLSLISISVVTSFVVACFSGTGTVIGAMVVGTIIFVLTIFALSLFFMSFEN